MKSNLMDVPRAGRLLGRFPTRDEMMTFDRSMMTHDASGNHMGRPLTDTMGRRTSVRTHDGKTCDSSGAFLVGELERLDQTLHDPLVSVTWGRDIDLREDVTIADEISSFTNSFYGSASGLGAGQGILTGKAWAGKNTDQITGVDVDISKTPQPLTVWAMELKYTILELESAAKLGRPIDEQKYKGLQMKHQMDIDEQVYVGDSNIIVSGTQAATGLVNSTLVTPVNVSTVSGNTTWASKINAGLYDAVTGDVNTLLTNVWAASGWAIVPNRLLLPPADFGLISTQKVSTAGNVSILKYIQENNILTTSGRGKLEIYPLKWLNGAGASGTIGTGGAGHDRMVAYTKDKDRVRFPMTMLQRTPVQYDSLWHKSTYFCRLGVVEFPYSITVGYADGLS
jgi:hypothetical protein